jgi:small subunit ribosomal protein S7
MRSKPAPIKIPAADAVYSSVMITKLINRVMKDGKKNAARKQIYQAMDLIKSKTNEDPMPFFLTALENIKPQMEVRARRIGGAAYQVPVPVRGPRRDSLALRWLIHAARSRPNTEFHSFAEKLTAELMDAANNTGVAVKKKLDTHRMAEANKAFAHFRW